MLEGDNGFTIVRVDSITDAHPKELSEVEGEIQKMWAANEKNAIAQEIINDVTHDLENGDEIGDVGRRFELPVKTTKAIKHTENFAGLSRIQIEELFQEKLGTPKLISNDEVNLIVVPTKVIKASDNLSKEELEVLRSKAQADMSQAAANELIDAYGSNYKVRVKYKYLGLAD